MVELERLAEIAAAALDRGQPVPLLVLQLAGPVQSESQTARAFREAARRVVREGDTLGHDAGSDRFSIAMLERGRGGLVPGAREIRAALERIAAAMSLAEGCRMQTGWWVLESRSDAEALGRIVDLALERGRREREHFAMLATVGHELRTPLTSIRGYIETLLDDRPLDAETRRRFLETARREALRLGRLVDGMLEFSMLDLSLFASLACCDVVEQIGAAIDAVLPLARRRSIAIEARDLPQMALARVDADGCAHALLNLLENAIKYGRTGGRVVAACRCDERFVSISIDDDGPGIARAERDAVFRMGVRGSAAVAPGSGIGLAVVRSIAECSGGDVTLRDSPLGGARFVIRFRNADRESQNAS